MLQNKIELNNIEPPHSYAAARFNGKGDSYDDKRRKENHGGFINYNVTIQDDAPVDIGTTVILAPT